jgi:hypothetical protein
VRNAVSEAILASDELTMKVEEETGFDLAGYVNERDQIKTQTSSQMITMFIAPGIDESTKFAPQTRMEIGVSIARRFY